MELKKLFRLMMEKINDTIFMFNDEIIKNNAVNTNLTTIKEALTLANNIFHDYKIFFLMKVLSL